MNARTPGRQAVPRRSTGWLGAFRCALVLAGLAALPAWLLLHQWGPWRYREYRHIVNLTEDVFDGAERLQVGEPVPTGSPPGCS